MSDLSTLDYLNDSIKKLVEENRAYVDEFDISGKVEAYLEKDTTIAKKTDINYVNVKDYGAIGDGVADDTQAIKDAINKSSLTGYPLYMPQGTYLISSCLNVKNGVCLNGDNAIIVNTNRTMAMRLYGNNILKGIHVKGVLDEDIDFETDDFEKAWQERYTNGWDTLIFASDVSNIVFKDCTVSQNLCEGIKVKNGKNITVESCTFKNTDCAIIAQGTKADMITIEKCIFDGHRFSEKISIYSTEACKNIFIRNNIFDGVYCVTNMILVGYEGAEKNIDNTICSNVEISGNYINNCIGGIMCVFTDKAKIFNNRIENVGTRGIGLSYCKNIDISENTINKSSYTAMVINNSINIAIKNNRMVDGNYKNASTTIGFIRLSDTANVKILNNNFMNVEDETNICALALAKTISSLTYEFNEDESNSLYLTNATELADCKIVTKGKIIGNFADALLTDTNVIKQTKNNAVVNLNNEKTAFSMGYNTKLATKGIIKLVSEGVVISDMAICNAYKYKEVAFIVDTTSYGFTKESSSTLKWKTDGKVESGGVNIYNFLYINDAWHEI